MIVTERIEQELTLLRAVYPDLEWRPDAFWVRIPDYPVPVALWETCSEGEVAFRIPPTVGEQPYAFWVRPGLTAVGGRQITNYTYPTSTCFGDGWAQFSWAPEVRAPTWRSPASSNMLNFVRSFADRLREGPWMIQITVDPALWEAARQHLDERAEQVGFFLADWSPAERQFRIRRWQPVLDGAADVHGQLHVSLPDETRSAIIKWAWAEQACLIEAHSHGRWGPAAFSVYDQQEPRSGVPICGGASGVAPTRRSSPQPVIWTRSPGSTARARSSRSTG